MKKEIKILAIKASDREFLKMRIDDSIITVFPSCRFIDGKKVVTSFTLMNETSGLYHRWITEEKPTVREMFKMARAIA